LSATEGTLLAGRIRYAQPATGYRTGIEPVVLAACVPARPGELVLEAGTGAGAGLLCLAARVPGVRGVGVERDAGQAALARANFASNGFDLLAVAESDLMAWRPDGVVDHAFANPPWHDAASTPSPDALRAASKRSSIGLLSDWVQAMCQALRPRGTVSLILPAAKLAEGVQALSGACGAEIRLFPLWPRQGEAAKIVVLQGVARGGGACRVSPGLVLHGADGAYTDAAEAVLRTGSGLPIG
jgi:tRNA1Val (adenine37-N6)-methyltransferase